MIKTFTLAEMQAIHKEQNHTVLFEYFMDNYCKKLLAETHGLKQVHVVVSDDFKFEYLKQKLEIA